MWSVGAAGADAGEPGEQLADRHRRPRSGAVAGHRHADGGPAAARVGPGPGSGDRFVTPTYRFVTSVGSAWKASISSFRETAEARAAKSPTRTRYQRPRPGTSAATTYGA